MVESPTYTVERKDHDFEIRRYAGYILAQVDVESDFDGAVREGFSILAHYIFGGNTQRTHIPMTAPVSREALSGSERIPMTAPVTEEKTGRRTYRISFTMPSKYTLEMLPEPEDKRIKFNVVKSHRAASIRFSGRLNEGLADKKITELKNWLSENSITPQSNFIAAAYNAPYVPGPLRRDGIIVEIE